MQRITLTAFLLILSFLGIADAWYLGFSELTGSSLSCSIAGLDGCNTVARSAYSHILGIPFGMYGVAFYGLLFILAAALLWSRRPLIYSALHWLGWIGLVASLCFMLIQFLVIKALCIYCLGSAIIAFLACLVTIQLWKRFGRVVPVRIS